VINATIDIEPESRVTKETPTA